MASYQNPHQSGEPVAPSVLNWGDSLDPQDEPPYGHAPLNPPVPPPIPPYASAPSDAQQYQHVQAPQVQHAIQPHPFVEPTPYQLSEPPVYDSVAAQYAQSAELSQSPQSLSYGYSAVAVAYTGPPGPPESAKARAALWIGILGGWLPINLFVAGAAIAETRPGRKRGRDKAVIGLCCSLVWVVLIGGVAFALRHHRVDAAPPIPSRTTTSAGTDPGCYAGANAVYVYRSAAPEKSTQTTLGNALINAASRSRTADAPLRKLGLDYLSLAQGSPVPTLPADTSAASQACGLSFTVN